MSVESLESLLSAQHPLSVAEAFHGAHWPLCDDTDAARIPLGHCHWKERQEHLESLQETDTEEHCTLKYRAMKCLIAHDAYKNILEILFVHSSYLTKTALHFPETLLSVLAFGPEVALRMLMQAYPKHQNEPYIRTAPLMQQLRHMKRQVSLVIAVAELSGVYSVRVTMRWLSDFACHALQQAVAHVLALAYERGTLIPADTKQPVQSSGFIVLGMGKLGAEELNYSSDIDLIILYRHARMHTDNEDMLHTHLIRMTKLLVQIMDERTEEGYVFRTDLRLRPDPGATPIIISTDAAMNYYESQGQNWERAAMIKARPVAGDFEAGNAFLQELRPFIWRKNLDFAAILDIHSIKRQIDVQRNFDALCIAGHNVKLGRGGIREIEFFVQTQQLIHGGRKVQLREKQTVVMLTRLHRHGLISQEAMDEMTAAYDFYRVLEHRLQMVHDEQTHTLPSAADDIARLAFFMGFADVQAFFETLMAHLKKVRNHYARLFETSPSLGAGALDGGLGVEEPVERVGNLVFTGTDTDPETLETLRGFGFHEPQAIDGMIRTWHHGRYPAMRSTRAREMLTELVPSLLHSAGKTTEPDDTMKYFDSFLSHMPQGVPLFSMFYSHPQLLDLLINILGQAPRLARLISRRASLFGCLFDSITASPEEEAKAGLSALVEDLSLALNRAEHMEQVLDDARRWAGERQFSIGLKTMQDTLSPSKASWTLTETADAVVQVIMEHVWRAFKEYHGTVHGGRFAIIGLGKFGGHEMTPVSDLDMIFIYDAPAGASSDGEKALDAAHYFARLSQRLISALSAPTGEGVLYEVDMRLRPAGSAGAIACSLKAFEDYQQNKAWTWEHMALCRARVITAIDGNEEGKTSQDFVRQVQATITDVLCRSRAVDELCRDIVEMRARMDDTHHTDNPLNIKYFRGGLVDIEFIAQYLQLRYAADYPRVLSPNTWRALRNLQRAELLSEPHAQTLLDALDLWQALQGRLHLSMEENMDSGEVEQHMPRALLARLEQMVDADAGHGSLSLHDTIARTAVQAHDVFRHIIG